MLLFASSAVGTRTERGLRQHEYLARREAEAQEVVEEEVVQLVWAYEVFGLLLYVAIIGVSRMSMSVARDLSSMPLSAT